MYCSECGAEIPDDAKFCPFCAKPVVRAEKKPIPPPTQPFQGFPQYKSPPNRATGVLALAGIIFGVTAILLFIFGFIILSSSITAGITMLIIAVVITFILCVVICARTGGGGGCGGGDCSGCDCDCGDCAS